MADLSVIDRFTEVIGLKRFAVYVFDYGAPTGFRLAMRHPERITAIISQNGNAYEEGLSAGWNPIRTYWKEPSAANREAFTADGWFRSGDLGQMDGAGNVAITGRTKDVINRGGVKFNPAEVEMLLDSHPKILQSAIVPMPDPILGEKACAFVTLRSSETVSLEEIVAYLLEKNIAKNKLPEKLLVVAEMPLTPTRKIIKGRLKLP